MFSTFVTYSNGTTSRNQDVQISHRIPQNRLANHPLFPQPTASQWCLTKLCPWLLVDPDFTTGLAARLSFAKEKQHLGIGGEKSSAEGSRGVSMTLMRWTQDKDCLPRSIYDRPRTWISFVVFERKKSTVVGAAGIHGYVHPRNCFNGR